MTLIRPNELTSAILQIGSSLVVDATGGSASVVAVAASGEPGTPVLVSATTQTFGPFNDIVSYHVYGQSGSCDVTVNRRAVPRDRPYRTSVGQNRATNVRVAPGATLKATGQFNARGYLYDTSALTPIYTFDGSDLTVDSQSVGYRNFAAICTQGLMTLETAWVASGTPTPTPSNATLLAAVPKDGSALMALGGGSRQRYNGIGGGTQIRSYSAGPEIWSRALNRRYRFTWYNSSGADTNGNGMSGMLFAGDGEAAWQLWQRLPAIIASDAHFVVVSLSSNTLQLTNYDINGMDLGTATSAAGYVSLYQLIVNRLIAAGKAVIVQNFWERHPTAGNPGPVWALGSATRLLVPTISAAMKTWCDSIGVPFFDTRPIMIDPASGADALPITAYVQSDGTHESIVGGYMLGKAFDTFMAGLGFASTVAAVDETVAGNLLPNPAFVNTAGTGVLTGTWAAGSVVPDGWTLARLGTGTATVRSDFVTIGGRRYLKVIYLTAPTDGSQESWSLKPTANITVANGDRHFSRMRVSVDALTGYYGNPNSQFAAGPNTWAMMPTKPAGGGVSDMTDLTMHAAPTETYAGVFQAQPNLPATSTSGAFIIYGAAIRAGASVGAGVAVGAPEVRTTTDPSVIMYDEANTTPPTLTSPAALTAPEETPYSYQLTASKLVRWSLSGADAAKFTVDAHGLLRMVATPDFEIPGDADLNGIHSLNVVLTDFNPAVAAVSVPITVTVTDIDDGVTFNFSGTDGTDIADLYPSQFTRIGGATGAIKVNGNAAINDLTVARTAYMVTQQGDTADQEIRAKLSGPSAGVRYALRLQDQDNALYWAFTSGVPVLYKLVAGVQTAIYTTPAPYKTIANGDLFYCQILNKIARAYINGALVAEFDMSGAEVLPTVKRSGLISNTTSGSGNKSDDINFRVAAPTAAKVGLRALTASTLAGAAGAPFTATLTPVQAGSALAIKTDASGLFFTDAGNTLKAASPPAGTYNVTVTETNSNAAAPYAAGRDTTFAIVIS